MRNVILKTVEKLRKFWLNLLYLLKWIIEKKLRTRTWVHFVCMCPDGKCHVLCEIAIGDRVRGKQMDFPPKPTQQPNSGFTCFTIIHTIHSKEWQFFYFYFLSNANIWMSFHILNRLSLCFCVRTAWDYMLCYQVLQLNSTCSENSQCERQFKHGPIYLLHPTPPPAPSGDTSHTHRNDMKTHPHSQVVLVMRHGDSSRRGGV